MRGPYNWLCCCGSVDCSWLTVIARLLICYLTAGLPYYLRGSFNSQNPVLSPISHIRNLRLWEVNQPLVLSKWWSVNWNQTLAPDPTFWALLLFPWQHTHDCQFGLVVRGPMVRRMGWRSGQKAWAERSSGAWHGDAAVGLTRRCSGGHRPWNSWPDTAMQRWAPSVKQLTVYPN